MLSMRMMVVILLVIGWNTVAYATEFPYYDCLIKGVYVLKDGKLIQRPDKKALGKSLRIDKATGEVSGYFGTDGHQINRIKRPEGELLTVEIARGAIGDAIGKIE